MQKNTPKKTGMKRALAATPCILSYKYVFIPVFYYLGVIIFIKVFNDYLTAATPRNRKKLLYFRFLHHSKTPETFKCASLLSGLKLKN